MMRERGRNKQMFLYSKNAIKFKTTHTISNFRSIYSQIKPLYMCAACDKWRDVGPSSFSSGTSLLSRHHLHSQSKFGSFVIVVLYLFQEKQVRFHDLIWMCEVKSRGNCLSCNVNGVIVISTITSMMRKNVFLIKCCRMVAAVCK